MSGAAQAAVPPGPRLLLPWGAMLLATIGLAALGRLAVPAGESATGGPVPALASVLAKLGVVVMPAVLALDRALLSPARIAPRLRVPDRALAERYVTVAHLALWSLAGLPAILGFAHVVLGGALPTHLALCAVSLGLLAVLMPTRGRIGGRLDAVVRLAAARAARG